MVKTTPGSHRRCLKGLAILASFQLHVGIVQEIGRAAENWPKQEKEQVRGENSVDTHIEYVVHVVDKSNEQRNEI
ncbi:hypothetical protein BgiBS90_022383 [Biomphalaria glabrata]|nr:hypothetical protein BgiBS90_022383 [Biomphalaria glabrata]